MQAILRSYFYVGSTRLLALSYASAGLVGTTSHYLIFFLLLQSSRVDVVIASTIGAIVGGLTNYILGHRKVFRSNVRHPVALARFAIVAAVGVCINALVLGILVAPLGTVGGQLLASLAVLSNGFMLNKKWSFRD